MSQNRAMRTLNTENRKDGRKTLWKNVDKDDVKPMENKHGILRSLHDAALDKASEAKRPLQAGKSAEQSTLSEDQMIQLRLRGQTEEAAREIAFQAREQIDFLHDVQSRVANALKNSDEILNEDDPNAPVEELKGKRWVDQSRRMINGAVFRYNESCEERHEQLTAFCDWFELYENIWPLPLVQNDLQYNELLGKDGRNDEDEDADLEKISALWPKMAKMREDLGHIMSVTSEMGQKALNAELREELTRQANKINELNDTIEILQKALDAERKIVQEQLNEMSKMRNMHEVAINRRNEEIRLQKEHMEQMQLDHEGEVTRLNEKFDNMVEQFENNITELRADHDRVVEGLEGQIGGLYENIASLEATIVDKDEEIDIRDQSIEALTQSLDQLGQEHNVVKVQLGQVMDELRSERDNPYVKRLEGKNAESMRTIASLEEQLEEARGANVTLRTQVAAQGSELATLVEDKKKVDYDFKQQTVALEAATAELVRLRRENAGQKQAMEALAERLNRADEVLLKEKERLGFLIDDEKQRSGQLQAELEQVGREKADAERRLKFLSHDFQEKEAKLQEKARTLELKARASEKKRKTEVAALEAERAALQGDLKAEAAAHAAAMAASADQYEGVLAEQGAELEGLRSFKAFHDAKRFADLPAQTDLADHIPAPGAPATGPSAGGEAVGEAVLLSRAQRIARKFKALRDKVVEVRIGFEQEVAALKLTVAHTLRQHAARRHHMLQYTARAAAAVAEAADMADKGQWLSSAEGVEPTSANEMVATLCGAVTELVGAAEALVSQDQGREAEAEEGRGRLLEGVPDTIVELEHILEGVEGCLSISAARPGSADSGDGSRPSSAAVAANLRPLLAMSQSRVEAQLAETTMDFSRLSLAEQNRLRATIQVMGPPASTLERIAREQLYSDAAAAGGGGRARRAQPEGASREAAASQRSDGAMYGALASIGPTQLRDARARGRAGAGGGGGAPRDLLMAEGHKIAHELSQGRVGAREGLMEGSDAEVVFASLGSQDVRGYLTTSRRSSPPPQRTLLISRRHREPATLSSMRPPTSPRDRPQIDPVVGLPFAGAPRLDTANMRGRSREPRLSPEPRRPSLELDDKMVVSQPGTPRGVSAASILHFQERSLSPAAREAQQREVKFRDPSRMASLAVTGHPAQSPPPHPDTPASPPPQQAGDEPRSRSGSPDALLLSRPGTELSGHATRLRSPGRQSRSLFPGSTLQERRFHDDSPDPAERLGGFNPTVPVRAARGKEGGGRPRSVEPGMLVGGGFADGVFVPSPDKPYQSPGPPPLSGSRAVAGRAVTPGEGRFAEDFRASRHQLELVAEIDADTARQRASQAAEAESRWAPEGLGREERRQQALRKRAATAAEVTDLSGPHHIRPGSSGKGSGPDPLPSMRRQPSARATAQPPAHLVHAASPSSPGPRAGLKPGLSPLKGTTLVSPSRDPSPPKPMPQLSSAFDPSRRSLPPGKVIRAVTPTDDGGFQHDGRRTPERAPRPAASWSADLLTAQPDPDGLPAIARGAGGGAARVGREERLAETLQVQRVGHDRQT